MDQKLIDFLRESLLIEGIHREPSADEIGATELFMSKFEMSVQAIIDLQEVYAPEMPLRSIAGMNVRVGRYIAPDGGPAVEAELQKIVKLANRGQHDPWTLHVRFEKLHPFMDGNGRTGRALWAWQMHGRGEAPFTLSFLHRFYYQTLAAS